MLGALTNLNFSHNRFVRVTAAATFVSLARSIVSYTDISAQMAPIDVVRMLDELYRGFGA